MQCVYATVFMEYHGILAFSYTCKICIYISKVPEGLFDNSERHFVADLGSPHIYSPEG